MIASGILKLYPVEPFEYTFVEQGLSNWALAPYLARCLIASEIFLGLMVILNSHKNVAIKGVLFLLVLFTIYLGIGLIRNGNNGNCGCFGTFLSMTPLQSIFKNFGLMIVSILLLKINQPRVKKLKWLSWIIAAGSLAIPFILNPVEIPANNDFEATVNEKIDFNLLPPFKEKDTLVNFSEGEKILAFMSVNCSHCKLGSYKLFILTKQYNLPPVYVFFIGEDWKVDDFFSASRSNFPYVMFQKKEFFKFSGPNIPSFLYVKNGTILKHWNSETLTESEVEIFGKREAK